MGPRNNPQSILPNHHIPQKLPRLRNSVLPGRQCVPYSSKTCFVQSWQVWGLDVNARRHPDAGNFAALMHANELRERVSAIAGKQQDGKLGLVSGVEGRASV